MLIYNGEFVSIRKWLLGVIKQVEELIANPPLPREPSKVKKIKRYPRNYPLAQSKEYAVSSELPKDLCGLKCGEHKYYECEDPDTDTSLYIPTNGSKDVIAPLHYHSSVVMTKTTHIVTKKYVDDLADSLIASYLSGGIVVNDHQEIRLASPFCQEDYTTRLVILEDGDYNIVIGGGGGSGASMVGKNYTTIDNSINGGLAGEVLTVTYGLNKNDIIELTLGGGGSGVTSTYDNTVTDSTPYYSTDGIAGTPSSAVFYEPDGVTQKTTALPIIANGGAGGERTGAVRHIIHYSLDWYESETVSAEVATMLLPTLVSESTTHSNLDVYHSSNSLLHEGIQPAYTLEQGRLAIRGNKGSKGSGGSASFNAFEYNDNQVFTATSGRGGAGFIRMWRVACD